MWLTLCMVVCSGAVIADVPQASPAGERLLRYSVGTAAATRTWQRTVRRKLYELMMGGGEPRRCPLNAKVLQRVEPTGSPYVLEEVTIQSLPGRRAHLWMAIPRTSGARRPVVLAIHGHGGTGEQVVRGQGLYWYGKALAEMGYVVVAPDVGSHELQHKTWSLMGERVWDCIRALDYAAERPEADPRRMAVCGLSLGGETAMYVGALDLRVQAVCSSGWLTTVANMRQGHCPCYDFPGLAEHFDFADIFACIAPRPLVCEIGEKERAPGGFPVEVARPAFSEILQAYEAFKARDRATLTVHPEGHVFVGYDFWPVLRKTIGAPQPYEARRTVGDETVRRGRIYDRALAAAVGVLRGWWTLRDSTTGLLPRTTREAVWAPNDNAADLMPFLFLTDYYTAAGYSERLLEMLKAEARLTNRNGCLPDWFSLERRAWVHDAPDVRRLIFGAAEYCKDGLMPMTEAMGRGPWTDRMLELLDAIIEKAPVRSRFGMLPADDTEVNGDLLQVLGRVYAMTGETRYLEFLLRITDAYCYEVLPRNNGLPAHRWNFAENKPISDSLNLNDHGNEILLGLAEAYIAAQRFRPEKAEQYRSPLRLMFRRLMQVARNPDGLWWNVITPSTGEVRDRGTPDTWGYALCGALAFADATGDRELREQAVAALQALEKSRYLYWVGADAYADSIEGALLVRNHIPSRAIDQWLDLVLPLFFRHQQENGIVEGWYGDGNFARTALMVALYHSQGVRCLPWQEGLGCGAVALPSGLLLSVSSTREWAGRLVFDTPRHRDTLRLSADYPRLNKWPEWFTVDRSARYRLHVTGMRPVVKSGEELAAGIELSLQAGQSVTLRLERLTGNRRGEHSPNPNVE